VTPAARSHPGRFPLPPVRGSRGVEQGHDADVARWLHPNPSCIIGSGGTRRSRWGGNATATVSARMDGGRPRAGDPPRDNGTDEGEVVGVASVYDRVRSIVAERLGVDEDKVTMDAEFIGDLNADSLDLVEVIMAMEQEFNLEIKDEDAENIRSVSDAVEYITEHGG